MVGALSSHTCVEDIRNVKSLLNAFDEKWLDWKESFESVTQGSIFSLECAAGITCLSEELYWKGEDNWRGS